MASKKSETEIIISNLKLKSKDVMSLKRGQNLWYLSTTSRNLEIREVIFVKEFTTFSSNEAYGVLVKDTEQSANSSRLYLDSKNVFSSLEGAEAYAYHFKRKALLNKVVQAQKTLDSSKKALEDMLDSNEQKAYERNLELFI